MFKQRFSENRFQIPKRKCNKSADMRKLVIIVILFTAGFQEKIDYIEIPGETIEI